MAVISDLKSYKVSNVIILVGLITGCTIRIFEEGKNGICLWGIGVVFPVALLWIFFIVKTIGAGDIKLFSVVGGFFGVSYVFKVIILSLIIGGVMSVFQFVRYKNLAVRLQYFSAYISNQLHNKKIESYYRAERDGRSCVIHFSIAIGISVIIMWGGII